MNRRKRAFRVPDEVWQLARDNAERDGESMSMVIERVLARYVERDIEPDARWSALRVVQVDDDAWQAAQDKAESAGEPVAEAIRREAEADALDRSPVK